MSQTRTAEERAEAETEVTAEEPHSLSPEEEQVAAKRATLGDHYSRHREKLRANAREEANKEGVSHGIRKKVARKLESGLEKLVGAKSLSNNDQVTAEITGIETKPELDVGEDPQVLEENEIELLRFELDHDETTPWYTYDPSNPEHSLNKIIDFYVNGDLTSMFYVDVRVTRIWDGSPHIVHPEPYDTRLGHLRYKVYSTIEDLYNDPEEGKYAIVHAAKNDEELETEESEREDMELQAPKVESPERIVTGSSILTTELQGEKVAGIASIPFIVTTFASLYGLAVVVSRSANTHLGTPTIPALPLSTQEFAGIVLGMYVTSIAFGYGIEKLFNREPDGAGVIGEGFIRGTSIALGIVIGVIALPPIWIGEKLVSAKRSLVSWSHKKLNSFNPYERQV